MVANIEQQIYETEEQRLKVLARCKKDLYYLNREVLGYDLLEPTPHRKLCAFIQTKAKRKLLCGMRGIYKTTCGTIGRAIQLILKDPNVRILIVCNTFDNAAAAVGQIKDQFELNPKLYQLVPGLVPANKHNIPWAKKWLRFNRTKIFSEPTVRAAGVETQLASQHYDYILGDDVVAASRDDLKKDDIIIIRPEELDKAIGWFKMTMRGMKQVRKDKSKETEIQFILNRWGVEDFARFLLDKHLKSEKKPNGFEYLDLHAHKEDGSLQWPTVYTEEKLAEEREDGEFLYWTQLEGQPYNPGDRRFPVEDNIIWEGDRPPDFENMKCYGLIDLAEKSKAASCNTGIIVLYVDEHNHIWTQEANRGKMSPTQIMDVMFKYSDRYQLPGFHVEEVVLATWFNESLKHECKERGTRLRVWPLKHRNREKDMRILRLQPMHRRGALHIRKQHYDLLQELRDFPFTNNKDLADALAYIMDIIRGPVLKKRQETPIRLEDLSPLYMSGRSLVRNIKESNKFRYGPRRRRKHPPRIAV